MHTFALRHKYTACQSAQKQKKRGSEFFFFVTFTSGVSKTTYHLQYTECGLFKYNYYLFHSYLLFIKRKQIKRALLFCCGSGRVAGDVVQSSSESLVRQTLPWAHMSSRDQYGITAPQIQTLTLHYIAPVPLQASKG